MPPTGTHLSSKRYDHEIDDIFAIQDEISEDIAAQLKLRLALRKRSTTNLTAYQAYLEGRYHWNKFTPEGFAKALESFQRAVALDPDYAPAHTGVAMYYVGTAIDYVAAPLEVLPKAAAAARRALELDETNADAHAVLGDVAAMLDFDWVAAERHFARALELNPGTPARVGFTLWFLQAQGRAEEARAQCDRVIEQDPLFLGGHSAKAIVLFLGRNYDAAVQHCLRALDLAPAFQRVLQHLAYIRAFQGRVGEALAVAERLSHLRGRSIVSLFALSTAHAMAGDRAAAHRALQEMKILAGSAQAGSSMIACVYALLEERDAAFDWMERAVACRDPRILWIRSLPWWDALRSDPRYAELLRKMNWGSAAG
ncbi:MAG: hypothetical protein WDO73_36775 [Ignavibacteriota bacterium]